jgi:hypothetical protein
LLLLLLTGLLFIYSGMGSVSTRLTRWRWRPYSTRQLRSSTRSTSQTTQMRYSTSLLISKVLQSRKLKTTYKNVVHQSTSEKKYLLYFFLLLFFFLFFFLQSFSSPLFYEQTFFLFLTVCEFTVSFIVYLVGYCTYVGKGININVVAGVCSVVEPYLSALAESEPKPECAIVPEPDLDLNQI